MTTNDILTMTDEELDLYIANNETDFNGNLRGRAYKRVQRRNKINKRKQLAKDVFNVDVENDDIRVTGIKTYGYYGKRHPGCQRARCKICHYSKIYKLPTLKEIKANEKMKSELADMIY